MMKNVYNSFVGLYFRYIAEPPLPREADPFHWWRSNRHIYPILSVLARQHLCFIATSVPCERMFSKTGIIISERRSRLKPARVRELVYLNVNYKYVNIM